MTPRRWDDEQLATAVPRATSRADVCRRLGISPGGGTDAALRRHADALGLDVGHLPPPGGRPRRGGWDDADLASVDAASASHVEVARPLGYRPSGGIHRHLRQAIHRLGLSTSPFTGRRAGASTRGRSRQRPLDELLRDGSRTTSSNLRARLVAEA